MLIEITGQHLAQMKRDLEHLKQAQNLAKSGDAIPVASYRYDMSSLISSGIDALEQIIGSVEQIHPMTEAFRKAAHYH